MTCPSPSRFASLLAVLALLFTSGSAFAQERGAIDCVVGIPTGRDGVEEPLAVEALAAMREALRERDVRLVEHLDRSCLADTSATACGELLEEHDCDAILVATVDLPNDSRPSPVLSIDLYNAAGAELGLSRAFTSPPTVVAAALIGEAIDGWREVQPITWTISGTPEGAAVQVDQALGRLPFTTTVRPGRHTLTVRAPGFETHREEVTLEPGQGNHATTIELVEGESADVDPLPSAPTPWQKIVGPVMVGVGVAGAAAVVVGTVVSLDDGIEDATGRRSEELALGPTLAYAGIGVAIAMVGVLLWATAPSEPPTESRTTLSGSASPGAAHLELTHTF